ncbi:MAG: hypothetical protein Q4D38_12355 [Planctomycetia bacterium]|nr:hypothetical protein [Planctomycetia bacterium]
MGRIHNPGDSLSYEVEVLQDGTYQIWMRYGAMSAIYGVDSLDGRLRSRLQNIWKMIFVCFL